MSHLKFLMTKVYTMTKSGENKCLGFVSEKLHNFTRKELEGYGGQRSEAASAIYHTHQIPGLQESEQ